MICKLSGRFLKVAARSVAAPSAPTKLLPLVVPASNHRQQGLRACRVHDADWLQSFAFFSAMRHVTVLPLTGKA